MPTEIEQLEQRLNDLTRQLDESPGAEQEEDIVAELERVRDRLRKLLREEREAAGRADGGTA